MEDTVTIPTLPTLAHCPRFVMIVDLDDTMEASGLSESCGLHNQGKAWAGPIDCIYR